MTVHNDPVSASELASALVERRRWLDAGEAEWLRWLAAFEAGELSYSKVRAMTRIDMAVDDVDDALIALARAGTAADLDRCVRHYQLLDQQDQTADSLARWERRGLRPTRQYDGMGTTEIVQPIEQQQRMLAVLDAYLRATNPVDKAPAGAAVAAGAPARTSSPVDEAPAGACADPVAGLTWSQRRVDALGDLLEGGFARLSEQELVDPESAILSVVVDYQVLCEKAAGTATVNGVPVSGEAARRLACDAGLCRIITRGESEILDVGRKTRHWNRAQRRAIKFRHHDTCSFPGCDHKILEIHHSHPWAHDGQTNLDAGIPLCSGHHLLVHEGGWTVYYDTTTSTTIFTNPHGQTVTAPATPTPWTIFNAA